MSRRGAFTFYEFFAGGGMARQGLGDGWACVFASDFDPVKARVYLSNDPQATQTFRLADVYDLTPADLPGCADLAWASSPCQDFSLAGARAGLAGGRSSAFFGFWSLIEALADQGRAPSVIAIENVVGLLTSRGGADFAALCAALARQGYSFGALEIDAAHFSPQSRPRVVVIASRRRAPHLEGPSLFHTRAIRQAYAGLGADLQKAWSWWRTTTPARRNCDLAAVLQPDEVVAWRTEAETAGLLALMDDRHRQRVEALAGTGGRVVGAVFRRTRAGRQRAEVRFDGVAGCLRTPRGGSSRQLLLVIDQGRIRSRWLTAREGARLMGLPDDYRLPSSQTAALKVIGDGVSAPVVRFLASELLEPLLSAPQSAVAAE